MSEKEKIVLGSNGIKKVLKGFSPVEAVSEYIWNGYDASYFNSDAKLTKLVSSGEIKNSLIASVCIR